MRRNAYRMICALLLALAPRVFAESVFDISKATQPSKDEFISFDVPIAIGENEWLVVWDYYQKSPNPVVTARVVKNDGNLGPIRKLVKNALIQDVAYDPENKIYMLLYRGWNVVAPLQAALFVQPLSQGLKKIGKPTLIDNELWISVASIGADYSSEIEYDPTTKKFLVFYLGAKNEELRTHSVRLARINPDGRQFGSTETLHESRQTKSYYEYLDYIKVFSNPHTRNYVLFVNESFNGESPGEDRLLEYRLRPGGKLLSSTPIVIDHPKDIIQFQTAAAAAFSEQTGLAAWVAGESYFFPFSNQSIRYRSLKKNGKKSGSAKTLVTSEAITDNQVSIFLDSRSNRFVLLWTEKSIQAVTFDSSGALVDSPFTMAPLKWSRAQVVDASYDRQTGKALIVWLERDDYFGFLQVRGRLF